MAETPHERQNRKDRCELASEESVLQRIIERIGEISASAVECAVGKKPHNCVVLLVSLTRAEADNRAKISRLKDQLFRQESELQRIEADLDHARDAVRRAESNFNSDQCSDFFRY